MPNIKSAAKRVEVSKIENMRNKANKTALKTTLKKFDSAVAEGNQDAIKVAYKEAVISVDKAVNQGILHKNNAARKKSRLTIALNEAAK